MKYFYCKKIEQKIGKRHEETEGHDFEKAGVSVHILQYTMKTKLFLLGIGLIFLACSPQGPASSDAVSVLSEKWMLVETALSPYTFSPDTQTKEALLVSLKAFAESLDEFERSPLFDSLSVSSYSPVQPAEHITTLLAEIDASIVQDRPEDVFTQYVLIDKEVNALQALNTRAAGKVHMTYFVLFYILLGFIICMVLVLSRFSNMLEHSRLREKQSAAFSRDSILAQEEERTRIARELHDTVAQDLRLLGLQISHINRDTSDRQTKERLDDLAQNEKNILGRIRSICSDLIPPNFKFHSLSDALEMLCHDFGTRTGVECRFTVLEPSPALSLSQELLLQCFRLVQESLTNIEKHAKASEITVIVRSAFFDDDPLRPSLLICVSDDGCGFARPPTRETSYPRGRMGIRGMYERITILEGKLDFISESGEGTMVRIEVPQTSPLDTR
jgi:signal transduction histidine kinase